MFDHKLRVKDIFEKINAWHKHFLGGTEVKVVSGAEMPRLNDFPQLWLCVQRKINGVVRYFVEYAEDNPKLPVRDDFFDVDAVDDGAADKEKYVFCIEK